MNTRSSEKPLACCENGGIPQLVGNYRSTPEVVAFFNAFVTNDPDFSPARVQPPKPAIQARLPSNGARVLGMFRADVSTLAVDLGARSILPLGLGAANCVVPLAMKPVWHEPNALDGFGGHVLADLVGSSVELRSHA